MNTPKNKEKIKVRTFFKTKKQSKIGRTIINPQLKPTQNQKYDQNNSEQKACWTLIQESLVNSDYHQGKDQPDTCLIITPRPITPNKQMTFQNAIKQINIQPSNQQEKQQCQQEKEKEKDIMNIIQQKNIPINIQKKPQTMSQNRKMKTIHSRPNFFIGKQVLCVTQYIVAGSDWNHKSLQNSRKQQSSRYIKVLKQMKSRNQRKRIPQTLQYSRKNTNRRCFVNSFFQTLKDQNKGLQKMNLNSRKSNKQRRSHSLRSSLMSNNNNHYYFQGKQASSQKIRGSFFNS